MQMTTNLRFFATEKTQTTHNISHQKVTCHMTEGAFPLDSLPSSVPLLCDQSV